MFTVGNRQQFTQVEFSISRLKITRFWDCCSYITHKQLVARPVWFWRALPFDLDVLLFPFSQLKDISKFIQLQLNYTSMHKWNLACLWEQSAKILCGSTRTMGNKLIFHIVLWSFCRYVLLNACSLSFSCIFVEVNFIVNKWIDQKCSLLYGQLKNYHSSWSFTKLMSESRSYQGFIYCLYLGDCLPLGGSTVWNHGFQSHEIKIWISHQVHAAAL